MTAKDRIAAAIYRIRLRISTSSHIFSILYSGPGDVPLQNAPSFWGREDFPSQYAVPSAHLSPHRKWHLDWFRRFCTAQVVTNRPPISVAKHRSMRCKAA